MKIKILIIFSILIVAGLIYYFGFYQKEVLKEKSGLTGIANPASVYCEEQGGVVINKSFDKGERGFCFFSDNSQCEEWSFYRGNCNKKQLKIEVLQEGTGRLADIGDMVAVHYTGILEDGTKFDSSLDKGQPFVFTLGAGRVIAGWEQGILGMQIGEKRKLIIAPELAYGNAGAGNVIPPNATLIFEVEFLSFNEIK